jgi:hypothetical protein
MMVRNLTQQALPSPPAGREVYRRQRGGRRGEGVPCLDPHILIWLRQSSWSGGRMRKPTQLQRPLLQ